jgi:uncharacterized membrane protein
MKHLWLAYVLGAVLCWGMYIPTLHHGQKGFGPNSAFRAFLFVGVAYFLIAVLVPAGLLAVRYEPSAMSAAGIKLSIIAGILGAVGALCVIFAIKSGAKPLYIAPLIFGGAPIINTIVTMIWDKPAHTPDPRFFIGIVLVGIGAAMVLLYKPATIDAHGPKPLSVPIHAEVPHE